MKIDRLSTAQRALFVPIVPVLLFVLFAPFVSCVSIFVPIVPCVPFVSFVSTFVLIVLFVTFVLFLREIKVRCCAICVQMCIVSAICIQTCDVCAICANCVVCAGTKTCSDCFKFVVLPSFCPNSIFFQEIKQRGPRQNSPFRVYDVEWRHRVDSILILGNFGENSW